jgi:hypothetical protein
MGVDMSAAFVHRGATPPPPRRTPIMWDYRADGYGYCWEQAPRLCVQQGELRLHMNADRSRLELYNRR